MEFLDFMKSLNFKQQSTLDVFKSALVFFIGALLLLYGFDAAAQPSGQPSAGLLDGSVKTLGDNLLKTIQWVAGIGAAAYILWEVVQVLTDRKTWGDVSMKCIVAVAIGAAPSVVPKLIEFGKSINI